jgi:hypothetical protein
MSENTEIPKPSQEASQERIDIDAASSTRPGIAGTLESFLRRFRIIGHLIPLMLLYIVGSICMGVSFVPSIYLFRFIHKATQGWPEFLHFAAVGSAIAGGYILYGFTLILVVPTVNFILPLRLRPWRGNAYSLQSVPWYIHNALTYIARYTFLEFITPTPFNILFYWLMGMKIGRGVQINTTNISDPCLITLEDKVTIGGSATVIAHYASGGFLIVAPVRIGKGATVGMKATIMGDVEIGEQARILPNSVVMPKSRIPAGEIWGGVPAQLIRKSSSE